MSAEIESRVVIVVPPALVPLLDRVITEQALELKQEPKEVRRVVEIAVLQRGLAAMTREGTEK